MTRKPAHHRRTTRDRKQVLMSLTPKMTIYSKKKLSISFPNEEMLCGLVLADEMIVEEEVGELCCQYNDIVNPHARPPFTRRVITLLLFYYYYFKRMALIYTKI